MKRRARIPGVEITARRQRVWQLHCRGLSEGQIAEREGVNQSQISRDLRAIHDELNDAPDAAARKQRAANVARERYGLVIAEALEEWQRSKQDRQRTKARSRGRAKGEDGKPVPESTEAEQTLEGGLGDPSYLLVAVKAQSRLDAIDGIDAAKQHAVDVTSRIVIVEDEFWYNNRAHEKARALAIPPCEPPKQAEIW